jgi:hypothetical protein
MRTLAETMEVLMTKTSFLATLVCAIGLLGLIPATTQDAVPSADLIAKLSAAKKPAVGQPLTINGDQVCGPKGNSTKPNVPELDNNKNRTDVPSTYVPIDWDSMKSLPADKVSDIQGAPVVVSGYLSDKIHVEGKESTNCDLTLPNEVDWHMYLTKSPNQLINEALVVEATPRVRPMHTWTTQGLEEYVNKNQQVRISGWLIYDFEHVAVIGKERAAVWEVHPITKIEVQNNGQWVNVEH